MKLIACHIENYGVLSNQDYSFEQGLNIYCENNGYGKSTFVSFVKAMFYGLSSVKKNTKEFEERVHFYPFSGGKFGGSISFESENKEYRIERFFDRKSATKDTCRIFCNHHEMDLDEYGDNLGRFFFGVDEESFMRTVYIDNRDISFSMTSDIGTAINRFIDHIEEDISLDDVLAVLDKKRKELKADRGNKGKIAEKLDEIRQLQNKIENLHHMQKERQTLYLKREELLTELATLEEDLRKREKAVVFSERRSIYENKLKEAEIYHCSILEIEATYPNGIPTEAEIEQFRCELDLIAESLIKLDTLKFDEREYKELSEQFKDGFPSEDLLAKTADDIQKIERLKAEIASFERKDESSKEDALIKRFQKLLPSEDEILHAKSNYANMRKKTDELNSIVHSSALNSKSKIPFFSKKNLFSASLTEFAFLLLGILLLWYSLPVGLVFFLLNFSLVTIFIVRSLASRKNTSYHDLTDRVSEISFDIKSLEKQLMDFLKKYGYFVTDDINLAFSNFLRDFADYQTLIEKKKRLDIDIQERRESIRALTEHLQVFFDLYRISGGSFSESYTILYKNIDTLLRLDKEKREVEMCQAQLEQDCAKHIRAIQDILQPYGIQVDQNVLRKEYADRMYDACRQMEDLKEKELLCIKEAEKYKEEHEFDLNPDVCDSQDLSSLETLISERQKQLAVLEGQISSLEYQLENLSEYENSLKQENEKLELYQSNYRLFSATTSFLRNAEETLKERYVQPIKERFLYYFHHLGDFFDGNIVMDKNFAIQFEANGELHSDKHLSMGQHTLLSICMRMAMIDHIYGQGEQFLVMDDPFVHLDAGHMNQAAELLSLLSHDRQILYFTCHHSRAVFS